MIAPACQHGERSKHGKDRKGCQRWKCRKCGATFSSNEARPLGDMRISTDEAALVLGLLLEGMSIRACERITGMKDSTICDLIVLIGERCDKFLEATVTNVVTTACELDELWGFIGCKQKTAEAKGYDGEDYGDSWTWLATCQDSKLILSHAVGDRSESTGTLSVGT